MKTEPILPLSTPNVQSGNGTPAALAPEVKTTLAEDAKALLAATADPNATLPPPQALTPTGDAQPQVQQTPLAKLAETPAEPVLTLETAMVAARAGLGRALRALIAMGIADGEKIRNTVENAYEAAKNELTGRTSSMATLELAAVELKKAKDVLANDSRANKTDLRDVRDAAATHADNLATLKAQTK